MPPNEVEERRVIRLLAAAAADVRPLPPDTVDHVLFAAARGDRGRGRPVFRRLHYAAAAAAVAVVALGSTLGLTAARPHADAPTTAGARDAFASFPEGSALRLLLAPRDGERTS